MRLDQPREAAIWSAREEVRPALRALWNIDLAFADVRATTVTPQLGEIRMAWWRERLQDLDKGIPPPAEPRLESVAADLLPAGVTGEELSRLEDCWLPLLNPLPWGDIEADAIAKRGAILFGIGARLLGLESAVGEPYGVLWSLADAAKGVGDPATRALLTDRAKSLIPILSEGPRFDELATLRMVAVRRTYDLLHGGGGKWHRAMFAFRYAFFGRI